MKKMIASNRLTWTTALLAILFSSYAFCEDSNHSEGHFKTKVLPVLEKNCFSCHSHKAKKSSGGLYLDSLQAMLEGGDSGPSLVMNNPEKSLLMQAIRQDADLKMPPKGKLSEQEIKDINAWVKNGTVWPDSKTTSAAKRLPGKISDEDRKWWAFQPVHKTPAPTKSAWAKNEVDAFIEQKLQTEGISHAPEASRQVLVRRLYFDLVGLPPTPQQVESFVHDPSPDAYEKLVDNLLASKQFGERWARHWLDLVRYADSDGYRLDEYRPQAWLYRDYVIRSFNNDKPYDRFIKEQIAGDEMFPKDPDALIATGYQRHWIYEYNQRDVRTQWNLIVDDITDTTGDVFLGLGFQCARCHDHKFDPILQKDYFRLRSFFSNILPVEDKIAGTPEAVQEFETKQRVWEQKTAAIRKQMSELEKGARSKATDSAVNRFPPDIQIMIRKPVSERTTYEHQLAELAYRQAHFEYLRLENFMKKEDKEKYITLKKELSAFENIKPAELSKPLVISEILKTPSPTLIPKKGNTPIEPGFLTILDEKPAQITPPADPSHGTGRRTALANWIASPSNPLTARVIVNRLWQQHFGRGLAQNSSDFGKLGSPPSHPELLDYLASTLTNENWSLKKIHRMIVTSATYRQASENPGDSVYKTKDPENKLLWKANLRRLEAEQIRDAVLSATGEINLREGGPGGDGNSYRRSIYTKVMRNNRDSLLDVFDAPLWFQSASSRDTTTTPVQSLLLINSSSMMARSRAFADRVTKAESDPARRVQLAYRLAYSREPSPEEVQTLLNFVKSQEAKIDPAKAISAESKFPSGKIPYRDGQAAEVSLSSSMVYQVSHHQSLPGADFTIEAFVHPRTVAETGAVRTIVSKRAKDSKGAGWLFGITGKQSRRKPQTLVLQMFGNKANGTFGEEALFSDQHIALNKPYYVGCAVRLARDGQPGLATFYLKDLSNDDEPLLIAKIPHQVTSGISNEESMAIGHKMGGKDGHFDGLIDDIRLSNSALGVDDILFTREGTNKYTVGFWQFEAKPNVFKDASGHGLDIKAIEVNSTTKGSETASAWVDLAQILLNSSEFLYVE